MKVTLIDTSVLCELLQVPGKSDAARRQERADELDLRAALGERLVVPVTAIIETGNHIVQSGPDRYATAQRFARFLGLAAEEGSPFLVPQLSFGPEFVEAVAGGAGTGRTLADLALEKVGGGDLAILVQREQIAELGLFDEVQVWTDDDLLGQLAGPA